MAKKSKYPLEKVTMNIVRGNKEILEKYYHALGWSVAARMILNRYCEKLEELESQEVGVSIDLKDIEIPIADLIED